MNRRRAIALAASVLAAAVSCRDAPAERTESRSPTTAPAASAATELPPKPRSAEPSCPPLAVALPEIMTTPGDAPIPPLERGESLAPFYAKLARLARGTARDHVRVLVYSDSNGTRDFMTGQMRRVLQAKYGDGGHGTVTLGRPWRWHSFMDVKIEPWASGWAAFNLTTTAAPDYRQGHALIAAQSFGGASTWVATAGDDAPVGKTVSRFEVAYLRGPRYGAFELRVDGVTKETVDASAKEHDAGFAEVKVDDAPHKLEIVTKGMARILGVTLERDAPGIVIDGVAAGMLNCRSLLKNDAALERATLARRSYDLLVLHLGTLSDPKDYAACQKELLARHAAALPGVPVLVMSPPDFLDDDFYPPKSPTWVPLVRDEQRKFAAENGLAFWDFFMAMGGAGSMSRFEKEKLTIQDGVHLSEKGGAYMGDRVVHALLKGFAVFAAGHGDLGCDPRP